MDRFPEAFERFESDVEVGRFQSYFELVLAFQSWAGRNWKVTAKQWEALDREAENLDFYPTNSYRGTRRETRYAYFNDRIKLTWRKETIIVRDITQTRFRDLRTGRFTKKP